MSLLSALIIADIGIEENVGLVVDDEGTLFILTDG
jgi:hypothetical protein